MAQTDLGRYGEIVPDHLHESGVSTTFFFGLTNNTLYINNGPGDPTGRTHRHTLQAHPEIIQQILPPDAYEQFRKAVYSEQAIPNWLPVSAGNLGNKLSGRQSGMAWIALNSYAFIGRTGFYEGRGVVSIWPTLMGGMDSIVQDGVPASTEKYKAVPQLLRALMGQGKTVVLDGQLKPITPEYVVVAAGEYGPYKVADVLGRDPDDPGDRSALKYNLYFINGNKYTSNELRIIRGCCHSGPLSLGSGLQAKTGINSKESAVRWLCGNLSPLLGVHPELSAFLPPQCHSSSIGKSPHLANYGGWYTALRNRGFSVSGYGEAFSFREWLIIEN